MSKLVLCGKSACGKTLLKERFISRGYVPSISYTTREQRPGEVEGVDYFFVSKEVFEEMISDNEFLEYEKYGKDYYGTSINTKGTIYIMSTDGIKQIPKDKRNEFFIIFIDIDQEIIIERLKYGRKWSDDRINERIKIDNEKFENFNDFDLKITNSKF